MVRLFVAIDLPDEIREQFRDVQESLRSCRARLTLVDQESMHITLKFIGEVSGSHLTQITDILQTIKGTPFSLELGLIGVNSQRAPRVVWAEAGDQGQCRALAGDIDTALATLGFEPEKRKFRPHITIARVRQFHESLFEVLAEVSSSCSGTIPVREFILKKSELTPDGPVYTDILKVPIKVPE
ncbi:RNA 2',3'-cyclic phosphodiesterase [Methanospirillum stamsii]|uniref:RNA 2',3'-cyclic phosphodiesterase n=1 Tax=Methanospirillum stamsii TaxID=1277351 RepID=A0A2V2N6L5_9EURY|nr:RNA 2',3'-cyclic phosphodiesterase [Methanospirillum stamsii]PWR75724.1 RNA 2',3'-cyclic phosphodiesterase [Methanospirillum stamsii]